MVWGEMNFLRKAGWHWPMPRLPSDAQQLEHVQLTQCGLSGTQGIPADKA